MASRFVNQSFVSVASWILTISVIATAPLSAQDQAGRAEAEPQKPSPIVIPDAPATIDPASLVSPQLAAKASVTFDGQSLREVINWLSTERSIKLFVDHGALGQRKLEEFGPVTEELSDEPVYLLLNRLETLGLGWYEKEDTLHITSRSKERGLKRLATYPLGDLIDAGYPPQQLLEIMTCGASNCSEPRHDDEGSESAMLVGDFAFVRRSEHDHREMAGILAAIRGHGRRTFTFDAPQNDRLRTAMGMAVSVDFEETPLFVALQDLAKQAGIRIRIDKSSGIRDRTPITMKLKDHKLKSVLDWMLTGHNWGWFYRDGILWVTTSEKVNSTRKTAVFDVRDLCRDLAETVALRDTLKSPAQVVTNVTFEWIEAPRSGVLVARQSEFALDELLSLLENYRSALRASKPRRGFGLDPDEMVTGYYRVDARMASGIQELVESIILPESWKSETRPNAAANIQFVSTESTLLDGGGKEFRQEILAIETNVLVRQNVVLVIHQSRKGHQMIGKLIRSILESQSVDPQATLEFPPESRRLSIGFGRGLIPAAGK